MLICHKGNTETIQVYSVTVMTHVKALQAGHSNQGTSEPITLAATNSWQHIYSPITVNSSISVRNIYISTPEQSGSLAGHGPVTNRMAADNTRDTRDTEGPG